MPLIPLLQRVICFNLLAFFCHLLVIADDNVKTKHLTLCVQQSEDLRSLIFVSTLDGKVSALNAANNGEKQWSLDFNDGPMLSSNIHSRELNDNGQWVRLIPSLNGELYKFDGENLETLPITTDQLLHSSYRYSNDLVFSGGKEVYSYGVHTSTGRILYECNVTGCKNNTDNKGYLKQEILVIKRLQQTVRAVESRTGIESSGTYSSCPMGKSVFQSKNSLIGLDRLIANLEKKIRQPSQQWNFSVGQHDLVLVPPAETHCPDKATLNTQIKAIIPEGLIWAVNESDPTHKLWQYKFDSPIVSVWRENANKDSTDQDFLEEISLFDSSQWIWGQEYSTTSPSLYVGMHQRQLYVQENLKLKNSLDSSVIKHAQPTIYPWKPYPASGTTIKSILSDNDNREVSTAINEVQCTTALSVLYNSEYVNGNGFYLYPVNEIKSTSTERYNSSKWASSRTRPMLTFTEKGNNNEYLSVTKIAIFCWSILCRWEVILAISIVAVFQFTWPEKYNQNIKDGLIPPIVIQTPTLAVETNLNDIVHDENNDADNFKSRYLIDFEQVDCLGKGGYGVVFEVKNRVDQRSYAIKRITLPDNKDSRERVMREVRTLAKVEHRNIVRYFNSWLECPPSGWQEKHDKQWTMKLSSSDCPSLITETETNIDSVCIDVPQVDLSSVESTCEAYELDNTKVVIRNDSVIFGYSNEKQRDDNALYTVESPYDIYKLDNTEMTNDSVVFERSSENPCDENAIYIDDSTDSSDVSLSNNITKNPPFNMDNSNSESIVFEKSDNNLTKEITDNSVTEETTGNNDTEEIDYSSMKEKESHKRRKATLALDLITKLDTHKLVKPFLYIQMELCQRLSLKGWLKQNSVRDPSRVLSIFQQIVDAVEYIHWQGLIHRDLKPSNIFFAFDNSIKVGDFGLVTGITEGYDGTRTPECEDETGTLDSVHTACVGTHLYMSPEQANGQTYNYKVDIYSLGIIYFELLTPFSTDMERAIVLTDLRKSIFPSNFAEKFVIEYELLKMMLHEDPTKRPTTVGIKARPPLLNYQATNEINVDKDLKSHFELPRRTRHSSTNSSNSISLES